MFLLLSERCRTHSFVAFEKCAEMGLVLESELVGYLLYGHRRRDKKCFGALREGLLDAGTGSHAEGLFDRIGDISGGEAHLSGVPVKVMVLLAVGINQVHKTSCYLFIARHGLVVPSGQVLSRQIVQE